ncbi:hypothetical protein Xmau_01570 [Xenorhabdus mauleonii]|uniref:Uncharacterized protein n=1 Tax=Xenorhabdus mauleonii TaxID=351675 RepID=A0A1I3PBF8_9GAMM|nr:hypothetical protein Xmau_01570 [Xenorhabdus mauleonii]SFJ18833.1 hypothetical protein SAMN05421680_10691 [Xenorhabdus mauleonii]
MTVKCMNHDIFMTVGFFEGVIIDLIVYPMADKLG